MPANQLETANSSAQRVTLDDMAANLAAWCRREGLPTDRCAFDMLLELNDGTPNRDARFKFLRDFCDAWAAEQSRVDAESDAGIDAHAQRVVAVPTTVRIGLREWPFTSYADASAAYRAAIDATDATAGCGSSGNVAPDCDLLDANGVQCGKVSYNGKVWACTAKTKYESGLALLYSPYDAAAK